MTTLWGAERRPAKAGRYDEGDNVRLKPDATKDL
jgi:hypothetical protein